MHSSCQRRASRSLFAVQSSGLLNPTFPSPASSSREAHLPDHRPKRAQSSSNQPTIHSSARLSHITSPPSLPGRASPAQWNPPADREKPACPYKPGLKLELRSHTAPQTFGHNLYGPFPRVQVPEADLRRVDPDQARRGTPARRGCGRHRLISDISDRPAHHHQQHRRRWRSRCPDLRLLG
jgi:hypothetical protein